MKRIIALFVALLVLWSVACAEGIKDGDYDVVTLPAASGNVYENINLLLPGAVNGLQGDLAPEDDTGKRISLADALDAAMVMLGDKLHISIEGEFFVKCSFYLNHDVIGDRCEQVQIFLDRSGEIYFDILVDMDGKVHQCDLHCVF